MRCSFFIFSGGKFRMTQETNKTRSVHHILWVSSERKEDGEDGENKSFEFWLNSTPKETENLYSWAILAQGVFEAKFPRSKVSMPRKRADTVFVRCFLLWKVYDVCEFGEHRSWTIVSCNIVLQSQQIIERHVIAKNERQI